MTVWSNVIVNNTATGDGGGIYLGPDASATIELNLIASNQILGSGAGIYCAGTSRPEVRSNLIADNSATSESSVGGGVLIGGFVLGDFEENVIKSNLAQRGGGIACLLKSEVSIFRNVIAYNKVQQNDPLCQPPMCIPFGAPGILVGEVFDPIGPAPNIQNNTIHANTVLGSCCLLETLRRRRWRRYDRLVRRRARADDLRGRAVQRCRGHAG